MANIKSQKKRILTNEKSRQRNVAVRSRVKTIVKKTDETLSTKDTEKAKADLVVAISEISINWDIRVKQKLSALAALGAAGSKWR